LIYHAGVDDADLWQASGDSTLYGSYNPFLSFAGLHGYGLASTVRFYEAFAGTNRHRTSGTVTDMGLGLGLDLYWRSYPMTYD
jgi:hypothetical protein